MYNGEKPTRKQFFQFHLLELFTLIFKTFSFDPLINKRNYKVLKFERNQHVLKLSQSHFLMGGH
jgi:hypothetical protein